MENDSGFFGVREVLAIHAVQIEMYGGAEGLRDGGLLESAVATPAAGYGGRLLHKDMFDQAAAYFFHLMKNHPFMDGNKRTAVACSLLFLENRYESIAISSKRYDLFYPPVYSEDALYELVMKIIEGAVEKPEIAEFFRRADPMMDNILKKLSSGNRQEEIQGRHLP